MNSASSPDPPRRPQNHVASKQLGREGEEIAAQYLQARGLSVLHRNWRSHFNRHELDIIALDGNCVVFVEVKSARSESFGDPVTWVTPRKQASIAAAARAFIAGWTRADSEFRFDVVIVGPPDKQGHWPVRHIPQAFVPEI